MTRPLAILLVVAGLLATPAAAFSFLGLQNNLVQFVLDQISVPGEFEVTAGGVTEDDDGNTGIDNLAVADADGVWLRIGRASLNWRPVAILTGGITINSLVAQDVEYLRAPGASVEIKDGEAAEDEAAEDDAGLFDWPRSPISLEIREMRLDRVTVAPGAIAEQGFSFNAAGNAQDQGDIQAAALQITRTDGLEGLIDLDYRQDFDAGTIDLTLTANEAPGGLVAELAGLPATSASQLSLVAAGPLTNWQVDLDVLSEEVIEVAGNARIGVGTPVDVTAALVATPGAQLDPGIARLLAPRATFDLAVAEAGDGIIRVQTGQIASPVLNAAAAGFYNRGTGEMDLTLDIAADPAIVEDDAAFAFEALGFEGEIRGAPEDLQGTGVLRVAGLRSEAADVGEAVLNADLSGTSDGLTFRLDGDMTETRIDRLGPDLLGRAELEAVAGIAGDVTRLDLFRFAARPLELRAEGQADPDQYDFRYSLSTPDVAPLAAAYDATAEGRLTVDGRFAGPVDAPVLSGSATAGGLAFEGEPLGDVTLTHEVRLADGPAGMIDLSADGSRYGPARVATDFQLAGDTLSLTEMSVAALDATITGAVDLDTARTLLDGEITLDIPSLERAEAALDLPLKGQGGGTVVLSTETLEGAFGTSRQQQLADLDLVFTDFEGFDAKVARLGLTGRMTDLLGNPGGDLALALERAAHPQGSLRRGTVDVTAESLTRRGSLDLDFALDDVAAAAGQATVGRITGEAQIEDIDRSPRATFETVARAIASEAVEGGARVAEMRAGGTLSDLTGDPAGDVTLTIDTAEAAGFSVERLEAEADLATLVSAPAVVLDATLGPVAGPDVTLESVALEADLADLGANGRGTATLTARRLRGAAAVESIVLAADMTGLIRPAGVIDLDIREVDAGVARIARADLDATLTDREGRTDVDARLAVPAVAADGATITDIGLTARAADALGTPVLDLALAIAAVEAEGLALNEPRLTVEGPLSRLALALTAAGEAADKPLDLTMQATANVEGDPQATVSAFGVTWGEAEIALTEALRIATAGGVTRLSNLALSLPGGRLSGDTALHGNGVEGALALDLDDLAALKLVSEDIPVSRGALDLTADFDTRPGRAQADIAARADGVGFEEALSDVGDFALALDTRWNGRQLDADATLSGPFGQPLTARAALPLSATNNIAPVLDENGPLEVAVDWAGRVGPLWSLVPLPDHVLDGDLTIDLDIGGTLAARQIRGGVTMRDGQYQNLETGTILTALTLDSTLDGDDTADFVLRGNDGASGTVEARVAVGAGDLDATVTANSAVLVRRDDVTAQISTEITAKGPLTGFALAGTTTIERAEIRLVNATPPSVADLGEVRIKGAPEPEEETGPGGDITLDLQIRAPQGVFVRGRGLQSEWMIELDVTGTAAAPVVVGSIEKRRGSLDILGRFFDLSEGQITFDGGREIDPRLNVELSLERDGTTGFIRVGGFASDPQISFASDPALPEDEVLPRVIFGRDSQSLSGIEALQLASAVATLFDGTGGFTDDLRGAVGLDVLSVATDAEGDTSVVVGRNVADGVFVGAEQPLGEGQTKVTVEVEMFDNVIMDGEVGGDGSTSIGLQWRKDF